jgi:metal-responsive CopG/Arc/MetJ family transcriptional regulator
MSRISITIPNELVDELMSVVEAKSRTEAIKNAIKNEIKQKKKEKIRSLAGKIDFAPEAGVLRHGDKRLG